MHRGLLPIPIETLQLSPLELLQPNHLEILQPSPLKTRDRLTQRNNFEQDAFVLSILGQIKVYQADFGLIILVTENK